MNPSISPSRSIWSSVAPSGAAVMSTSSGSETAIFLADQAYACPPHPFDVGRCHAIVLKNAPRPDIRGQLPFSDANTTALEIGRVPDSYVGTDIDRRMTKARDRKTGIAT